VRRGPGQRDAQPAGRAVAPLVGRAAGLDAERVDAGPAEVQVVDGDRQVERHRGARLQLAGVEHDLRLREAYADEAVAVAAPGRQQAAVADVAAQVEDHAQPGHRVAAGVAQHPVGDQLLVRLRRLGLQPVELDLHRQRVAVGRGGGRRRRGRHRHEGDHREGDR